MPIYAILQAGKSRFGGQPIWWGDPDNPQPFTINNLSVNGNIYIGSSQAVAPNNPNESTPIAPGGYLSFDGSQPVYYVIADGPNVQAIVYPGVISVFQPGGVIIASGGAVNVVEDASTPAPVQVAATTNPSGTTAAFSPPAGSWLYALLVVDYLGSFTASPGISDSGGHTWTQLNTVSDDGFGHNVTIWSTHLASAPGSITVTGTDVTDGNTRSGIDLAVRVVTGANANQSGAGIATTNSGGASTNNVKGNIVTTKAGSLVYICGCSGGTVPTPISGTTTIDSFNDQQQTIIGKSSANTTAPGSTSFGWTTASGGAMSWCAVEVIP